MTKQEILNVLIPHYEKCIEELKNDEKEAMLYLFINRINKGVCKAISDLFGIRYYSHNMPDWIKRNYIKGSAWWAVTPSYELVNKGLDACIESLQKRVDNEKRTINY